MLLILATLICYSEDICASAALYNLSNYEACGEFKLPLDVINTVHVVFLHCSADAFIILSVQSAPVAFLRQGHSS